MAEAAVVAERKERRGRWRRVAVIAALYLGGLVHWALFFGTAAEPLRGPSFTREDWRKEYRYVSILQQALSRHVLPYYISRPIHTRRFLSLPEVSWSPQVVLLRALAPGPFLLANAWLLYSLGFVGLLVLARRLRLTALPFVFLFLLFFLNGHLTAHLAVGHSMWVAHFLLPWFCLALLALTDDSAPRRAPLAVALVLFAVLLQGGFHLFVWCVMLVGLVGIFERRWLRAVAETLVWTAALGLCRLAPAYFLLDHKDQSFMSGFPSLAVLWRGLVSLVPADAPLAGGRFDQLNSWEYDHYVGLVGLAWLLFFGVFRAWRGPRHTPHGLLAPLAVMALVALGDLYAPWNALPIPLLSAERVSSRLLLLPLLFLALFAALRMQEWLDERPGLLRRALGAAGAFALAVSLLAHSRLWRIEAIEPMLRERHGNLAIEIDPLPVPLQGQELAYVTTVRAAAAVSLAAFLLLLGCWARRRPGAGLPSPGPG
jgi:hypothetical protein